MCFLFNSYFRYKLSLIQWLLGSSWIYFCRLITSQLPFSIIFLIYVIRTVITLLGWIYKVSIWKLKMRMFFLSNCYNIDDLISLKSKIMTCESIYPNFIFCFSRRISSINVYSCMLIWSYEHINIWVIIRNCLIRLRSGIYWPIADWILIEWSFIWFKRLINIKFSYQIRI